MGQEGRTLQQILDDWWAHHCGGKKIPQGRETEVFSILIEELFSIGYTRSQIDRVGNKVVEYGINRKGMPRWKSRAQILHKTYKNAVSLLLGGRSPLDKPAEVGLPVDSGIRDAESAVSVDEIEKTESFQILENPNGQVKFSVTKSDLEELDKYDWQADDDDIM